MGLARLIYRKNARMLNILYMREESKPSLRVSRWIWQGFGILVSHPTSSSSLWFSRIGHQLVEHEPLLDELRKVVREGEKAERLRAVQALRYATRRKEGLVEWSFDTGGVARKDLIKWAQGKVHIYFTRLN